MTRNEKHSERNCGKILCALLYDTKRYCLGQLVKCKLQEVSECPIVLLSQVTATCSCVECYRGTGPHRASGNKHDYFP